MRDLNYFAIRSVVRWAHVIPVCASVPVLAALLLFAWTLDTPAWSAAAVVAALFTWFVARLMVEIVVVIADTLLPR